MSDVSNWYETFNGNRPYTFRDVVAVRREAARLRSETVSRHIGLIGSGLWRVVSWVGTGLFRTLDGMAQGIAAMRLYEELSGVSDRELEKLGTDRASLGRYVFTAVGGSSLSNGLYAIDGGLPAATGSAVSDQPSRRAA